MSDNTKLSPFVWVDALCTKQVPPAILEAGLSQYPAFMVNRSMSQYPDCLFSAAELNLFRDIDPEMAWGYYFHGVRAKKRFAKWGKKKNDEDVRAVSSHYQVSRQVAEQYLILLTKEQLKDIKELTGGQES